LASLTDRLLSACRALKSLEEAPAILRFTCTFEAVWKACQTALDQRDSLKPGSPRTAFGVPGRWRVMFGCCVAGSTAWKSG
jgi:hypothetical protein